MNRNGRRVTQALVVAASTAYASRMGAQKASYRMMSSKNGNTPKSAFKRAFEWYLGMLERHALPTKAITSGIIGAIGDMTCQKVVEGKKTIRVRRTLEFIAITGILVGPGLHYWYAVLNRIVPGRSLKDVFVRTFLDQGCFVPPFLVFFFAFMTTVQGHPEQIESRVRNTWWQTLLDNWKLWPAAQIINFWLVPAPLQVLFSNGIGLIWNSYLSYISEKSRLASEAQSQLDDAKSTAKVLEHEDPSTVELGVSQAERN